MLYYFALDMAKIFVLEDDKDIREVIEWILESEEYKVVSFDSVKDFMSRDRLELPDLFILDVMLPDGSGLEVCSELRKDSSYNHIPILIMSAHASVKQVSGSGEANGFIQKPFDMGNFIETVHTHINAV